MLFNLTNDPLELVNLATSKDNEIQAVFQSFQSEAAQKWDFHKITQDVLACQRRRAFVWKALQVGKDESWDFNPNDDGRKKYIRSQTPLDELELNARFPIYQNVPAITVSSAMEKVPSSQAQHLVEITSGPIHDR